MKSKKLKLILTVCIGLTLTTVATAAVYVLSPPSPPRALRIDDITPTSCKLSFSPPADDGGLPVSLYLIEVKDARLDLSWRPYASVKTTKSAIKCEESGSLMKIRVRAENAAGVSPPSDKIVIRFPKVN
ncbi:fibronectin type III domain-containing protein [Gabonibacter chumensis]|uniref:fibronectin type III domain-containing protein n=1 Tax=Gabonibacter chumensis TaxID=2972474 RepID=UPI002573A373|nr:fibronectin type III domain-containing protein [Gabonibacter chumensis]MCR9013081.1 fibronectin type III domain-containing protein [Gabonibacter chumensis]